MRYLFGINLDEVLKGFGCYLTIILKCSYMNFEDGSITYWRWLGSKVAVELQNYVLYELMI